MSIFDLWGVVGIAIFVVAALLTRFLPGLTAYVLGPAGLIAGVVVVNKYDKLFVPFQSDGSAAGLVIPVIMWALLIGWCALCCVMIVAGHSRAKRDAEAFEQADREDRVARRRR